MILAEPVTTMKRRHNISLWIGFVLVLLAVLTYIPIFTLFPVTRDVPWVNYLLFLAGGVFLVLGLMRAFGQPALYRGKVLGSIFAAISLSLAIFFSYAVFYAARDIPASASAIPVGQTAPDFKLTSADGKQISLADQLKNNRAVVLIFYRGYW
jgi:hypothetical protein